MQVSLVELIELLDAHKGAMIVTMTTRTEPKLLVKSRLDGVATAERFPQGVERLAFGRYMVANNYEANVQAQREREDHDEPQAFQAVGLWTSQAHPGGAGRRFGRFMVIHVDKPGVFYMRARPDADQHGHPVKILDEYRHKNGEQVDGDDLALLKEGYLPAKSKSKKQEVSKEIPYRAIEMSNVLTVTFGGITYELDHDGQMPEWQVPGDAVHA